MTKHTKCILSGLVYMRKLGQYNYITQDVKNGAAKQTKTLV